MCEQENIQYRVHRIQRNDNLTVFLELMMGKNVTITATRDVIVAKPVRKLSGNQERE